MRRVVFNRKGGVGKTSISCNLAAMSAANGLRTLLIDLDIQGHSSEYLIGKEYLKLEDNAATFFKQHLAFFGREKKPIEFVYETSFEKLCLMPSSPQLAGIERDLESRHKIYKLRKALDELAVEFDRIYIDTPPALDFYSTSALIAADSLLIPFDCDSFSQQGLYRVMETLKEIQDDHNPGLWMEGIVVNQYQARARLPQQLVATLQKEQLPLLEPFLSSSVKMKESRENQRPLVYMAQGHKLTQEYHSLFKTLEESGSRKKGKAQKNKKSAQSK